MGTKVKSDRTFIRIARAAHVFLCSLWAKATLFVAEKGFPSPRPPSFRKGRSGAGVIFHDVCVTGHIPAQASFVMRLCDRGCLRAARSLFQAAKGLMEKRGPSRAASGCCRRQMSRMIGRIIGLRLILSKMKRRSSSFRRFFRSGQFSPDRSLSVRICRARSRTFSMMPSFSRT